MIPRSVRYTIFAFTLGLLIFGNLVVHMVSMNLSEGSLAFEQEITALKQANLRLESEVLSQSSLQAVAAFAETKGYRSGGPAIRWVEPVMAAR